MWGGDEGDGYAHRGEGGQRPRAGPGGETSTREIREEGRGVRGAEETVPVRVGREDGGDVDGAKHPAKHREVVLGADSPGSTRAFAIRAEHAAKHRK